MKTPTTERKTTLNGKRKDGMTKLLATLILTAFAGMALAASPLDNAHEAYVKGDFAKLTTEIREALKEQDAVVTRNALALLAKAYEVRGGAGLPVDWKLPPEIREMKVAVSRVHSPQSDEYGIEIRGAQTEKGMIRQLQLVRYPDHVVLDKQRGVGEWTEELDPDNGPEYELDGARSAGPVPEGLYLVNLELKTGAVTRGWVIVSDLVSTETPVVTAPFVGQTFSTGNPSFRWTDFRSPQYKSHELRTLWLGVARPSPTWTEVWSHFFVHPRLTETTIGLDPEAHGAKALENGRYTFYVNYKESRRLGDVLMQRKSVTATPFFVKK